jgi:catechol 2,3-dioxygenase-like lactoylglutathione lyase family enzyme
MIQKPNPTKGLRHVALYIQNFDECQRFYTELLGMSIDWQPDPDNLYLTSGEDNFALHRAPKGFSPDKNQRLDHIGFFLNEKADVDQWHEYLKSQHIKIVAPPKDHRDGSRSFYCKDPDGNIVQMICIR